MKILVTGGAGFVGSVLVPSLLSAGYEVVVFDTFWFGNFLEENEALTMIKADVRGIDAVPMADIEVVIHLANIANDPAVDLDHTLSWEVNVLATQQLLDRVLRAGSVRQFLYASSGSVYGVKQEERVTENLQLVPISTYNKTKMVAERICLSYADDIQVHCLRPATVCGLSPRMRFDVAVNMFVLQAFKNGRLAILGGDQIRPNVHIVDMVRAYEHFLNHPDLPSGCYNVGFENISIREIAARVSDVTGASLEFAPSSDPRSYRQDSQLLIDTGFEPKHTVEDAIHEVWAALQSGKLEDDPRWHTVGWMKDLELADYH